MRLIHRRFLVVLFALLQCMAPLMHAHAHAEGHGGIHVHGWEQAHRHAPETACVDAHHANQDATVGVDLALQPRPDGGHAMAGCAPCLPGLLGAHGAQGPPPASRVVLPGPPPHLIPLPGAPPAV